MHFPAIEAVLPTEKVTNDDVLARVSSASRAHLSARELRHLARVMTRLFETSGSAVRYWRARGETAVDLTTAAGREALRAAGIDAAQVDLLIYVGVGRGFLEPATANVFQDLLGLRRATCFDLLDACASWVRALHVARAHLRMGDYRCVMILNGEFNREFGQFELRDVSELEHLFPTFTIGEAATATVVMHDDADDEDYHASFRTRGDRRNLCMIPLAHIREYDPDPRPHATPMRFFSYGSQLLELGSEASIRHYREDPALGAPAPDIIFSHAASDAISWRIAGEVGLDRDRCYFVHGRFANTVSASVPLSMSTAYKEGRLVDGSRVLIGVGSAGMTTSWTRFKFRNGAGSAGP